MASNDSYAEYAARMHRVLEFIDQHLDQPLDLDTLARVAHFSSFHFHRLFSAWMGETLGEYLWRRRIEAGAMRLLTHPRLPILTIALSVGFGSAETFTRAFKARFGSPPTIWRAAQIAERKNSNSDQTNSKMDQIQKPGLPQHGGSSISHREGIMQVNIIERQSVTVAYLRYVGPYGPGIGTFWQTTYYQWASTHNLLAQPRYGIGHDDPNITAPEQCRYDACAEVPADFVAAGGSLKKVIPGGKYAVFHFSGPGTQVGEVWTALLRDWLPSSGYQLDARPFFEYYALDTARTNKMEKLEFDICIPVTPL